MPYKRERSPYYYVRRRNLPGYGDTGRLSTRVTQKRIARDMERLLDELAQRALVDPSWRDVLDAVCVERTISLPELLRAKSSATLDALKRTLRDPLLTDSVAAFEAAGGYGDGVALGLRMLKEYAPARARLGDITSRMITDMCLRAEQEGRKRNSVRRTLLRAISHLLRREVGRAERDRIFADVVFPAVDDTREVHLTPKEIRRLLAACEELGYRELGLVVRLALQTSADRGVLLSGKHTRRTYRGLLVRDLRIYKDHKTGAYEGEAFLYDTKTEKRSRSVPLTDNLCRELLVLSRGKEPDDPIFSLTYSQLDFPWKRVREKAGLEHVRFKDLRAQTAIYGEEAGIPQTVVKGTMGHSDEAMTRRYQARAVVMSTAQAEAIEAAMLPNTDVIEKVA